MTVKVYISGSSGNKEVKKRQQRVLLILDSRNVKYDVTDIAEPGNEEQKDFMQTNSTSSGGTISDPNPRHPLPPQIFNGDDYCGDYDQFDMANEIDEMEKFLKLPPPADSITAVSNCELKLENGDVNSEKENIDDNKADNVNNTSEIIENPPSDNSEIKETTIDENQIDNEINESLDDAANDADE